MNRTPLVTAAREATATAQHKAVAETALPVVRNLTDVDEIELALDVCEAGRAAAAKSRQFALVKEWAAKADDLKKQQAASQEYRQALAVMENDPAEPAANLAAGRYLCLVKGDWVCAESATTADQITATHNRRCHIDLLLGLTVTLGTRQSIPRRWTRRSILPGVSALPGVSTVSTCTNSLGFAAGEIFAGWCSKKIGPPPKKTARATTSTAAAGVLLY